MTENKRFKFADDISLRYKCIIDTQKGKNKDIHNVLKDVEVLDLLNEQEERIKELEKGILKCLFDDKPIGQLAEEMGLVE